MPRRLEHHFILNHLPLLVFLGPVIGVNLAYIFASTLNHVPDCIPYFSGCTSISSTGRVMPQKAVFLLAMIPTAIFSVIFWIRAEAWFSQPPGSSTTASDVVNTALHASNSMTRIGALASFFLLIYVCTLGIPGEFYSLTRKFGVLLYFGFTYIAQLLLSKRLSALGERLHLPHLTALAARLKWYCVFVMLFGLSIIPISLIEDPIRRKQLENILEWNYALLMCIYFFIVFVTWRRHAADAAIAHNLVKPGAK